MRWRAVSTSHRACIPRLDGTGGAWRSLAGVGGSRGAPAGGQQRRRCRGVGTFAAQSLTWPYPGRSCLLGASMRAARGMGSGGCGSGKSVWITFAGPPARPQWALGSRVGVAVAQWPPFPRGAVGRKPETWAVGHGRPSPRGPGHLSAAGPRARARVRAGSGSCSTLRQSGCEAGGKLLRSGVAEQA